MRTLISTTACLLSLTAAAQSQTPLLGDWPRATPKELGMDEAKLAQARDYASKSGGSGVVIYRGKLVYQWGDFKEKYDLKSSTKSFGVTALGLALKDGKVKLSDRAVKYHPDFGVPPESNRSTGWLDKITLFHLASQTAGFDKPGGYQPLLFEPGTQWFYSDGGPNWLAECLTLVYHRDMADLLFERVFTPLGISRNDLTWRANAYRPHEIAGLPRREFGSGVHANVDAMARVGYLYLHDGRIGKAEILSEQFVRMATTQPKELKQLRVNSKDTSHAGASAHYGLLWWNNADGWISKAPRSTYWTWGLFDSHIIVVPTMDLVIARAGKTAMGQPNAGGAARLRPFLEPIVESVGRL